MSECKAALHQKRMSEKIIPLTIPEKTSRLKPCPFCRCENIDVYKLSGKWMAYCIRCCAMTKEKITKIAAELAWNKRADWKRIEEGHPENSDFVLVKVKEDGKVFVIMAAYFKKEKQWGTLRYQAHEQDKDLNVLSWMPIPE